ncbi:MAG: prolyl oligopeptidase family serine peptidase [Akkermansiaceae bacterium]
MHKLISILLPAVIIPLSHATEHGGTKRLLDSSKEVRKAIESKISGTDVRHSWSEDGSHLNARIWDREKGEYRWVAYNIETGEQEALEKDPKGKPSEKLKAEGEPKSPRSKATSPSGAWIAGVSDQGLTLKPKDGEPSKQDYEIPKGSKWQKRFDWAPDSSAFVAWHVTSHPVREVHYVRSSPEKSLQPEHFTKRYEKPGDDLNIPQPVIFFTDDRKPLALSPELAKHPFQIPKIHWHRDSKTLTARFIERGFGALKIIEINAETRKQRILISEQSEKFVYVYGNTYCRFLTNGEEILWLSQQTGFNHLYLVNRRTGETIRPLTSGEWVVREVMEVDEKARTVLASVSGIDPEQDPYYLHYVRICLDTGSITRLTESNGTHEIFLQPKGTAYIAKWSRVDQPPIFELRNWADGKRIATLPEPDLTNLRESGWNAPERFVTKDRNGKFDIHGVIFRPLDFDPEKKYPVIENIYAGPHGSFVPKSWRTWYGAKSEMTEAGFIVVQIDGLGTNHRGKEFHEVAYKNLMDSGFPDRIKWMKAAAKKYPQMNLSRVGIYGGSAGGQSALAALLSHPDFYKAAAADCGCHDNRMDKIWWNEQWMDWPIDESYEQNANVTHIENLEGALLLTVGELDTNVDPSSTYQVVDALIKADKDFEYIAVPGAGHGVGETPYLRRKRMEFFQRHLQTD